MATLADEPDLAFQQVVFQGDTPLLDQVTVVAIPNELVQRQMVARGAIQRPMEGLVGEGNPASQCRVRFGHSGLHE